MTPERRREIFSKEILTYKEIGELFLLDNASASRLLLSIKRNVEIRRGEPLVFKKEGKILIEDYLYWLDTKYPERYDTRIDTVGEKPEDLQLIKNIRSVCFTKERK